MLGGLDVEEPEQLSFPMPRTTPGTINYLSVVCLLRGQVRRRSSTLRGAWYTLPCEPQLSCQLGPRQLRLLP